jgi:hypothetical protein
VRFNKSATPPAPLWTDLVGSELYDHTTEDSVENVAESINLVAQAGYATVVSQLAQQLHDGWRAS